MKIFGDYHIHSEFSRDAKVSQVTKTKPTVEDIVKRAKELELQEVAITDHGPAAYVGAKLKNFPHRKAMCERAERDHGIKVFCGVEANVMGTKGQIDVPAEMRKNLDILLCGIHVRVWGGFGYLFKFFLPNMFWRTIRWAPKGRIAKNTQVMKNAIEHNDIDVWTHPNLYFKLDVVEVARTCTERGTLIELNGSRISFRPVDFERMIALGAKFIINSDAHMVEKVGRIDRVKEFLKYCEYKDEDIINLSGLYRRPETKLLVKLREELEAFDECGLEHATEKEICVHDKKIEKQKEKERKRREKMIKKKG